MAKRPARLAGLDLFPVEQKVFGVDRGLAHHVTAPALIDRADRISLLRVSKTGLRRGPFSNNMAGQFYVNQRVSYSTSLCTIRYIGPVEGTAGEWLGVEWDEPLRGKHSGEHARRKYFDCGCVLCFLFLPPYKL